MQLDNSFIGTLVILMLGIAVWVYFMWSNSRASHKMTHQVLEQHHLVTANPEAHRLSQAVHLLHPEARLGIDYTISRSKAGEASAIASWSGASSRPSQEEIDAALARVSEADTRGYAAMRRAEYPSLEDQLDAAFKARHGDPGEQAELDRKIEEIKNKYPKSDAEL